jgi:pyruvate dehydrogenase E2 component (dihydrolipoamide acetyltransferase)
VAVPVLMPRQGQSVETCLLLSWKKNEGDAVAQGESLCEVETDKATFEVEAPEAGTLLKRFYEEGQDVPVLSVIAAIGRPGESIEGLAAPPADAKAADRAPVPSGAAAPPDRSPAGAAATAAASSPRARKRAAERGIDIASLRGSGPGGRVIERDVLAAARGGQPLTPAARDAAVAATGRGLAADQLHDAAGSAIGGRISRRDVEALARSAVHAASRPEEALTEVPVKGVRKIIAERMLASLQTTAQLTLHSSADARSLQSFRARLKESPESWGLRGVTITDLVLYALSRLLPSYPELNAHFLGDRMLLHRNVALGLAVDTPRGLMVPVIRDANGLSLKGISEEAKRLAAACLESKIQPDELAGGTFTLTNLGALGIESFTPVLNPPQTAILGLGNIQLKPVQAKDGVSFVPHLGLSLTINHQAVDGAPGARFLAALAQTLAAIDVALAL